MATMSAVRVANIAIALALARVIAGTAVASAGTPAARISLVGRSARPWALASQCSPTLHTPRRCLRCPLVVLQVSLPEPSNGLDADVPSVPSPRLQDALGSLNCVRRYLWPRGHLRLKARLIASVGLLFLAKLCLVHVPFMLKRGIDSLASPAQQLAVAPMALFAAYGGSRVMYTALQEMRYLVFTPIGQRAVRSFARDSFGFVQRLGMPWHAVSSTGETAQQLARGIRAMTLLIRLLVFNVVPTLLELALVVKMMAHRYDRFFSVTCAAMSILFVLWTLRISERRAVVQAQLNTHENSLQSTLFNSLINYETVGWFTNEHFEVERYDRVLARIERTNIRAVQTVSVLNIGQMLLFASALSLTMGAAASRVVGGTMTVGDVTAINGVLLQLLSPLTSLSFTYQEIRQSIVDMGPALALHRHMRRIAADDATRRDQVNVTDGRVVFDHVTFAYPRLIGTGNRTADYGMLRNVSFTVTRGQKVAIVGSSGSGKSTVLKLIGRFYEPLGGRVLIDGQDLAKVDGTSVRAAVGLVPQDAMLFDETIMFNIRYGNLNATDEEVVEAAKLARLHESIMRKPEGYDTRVGERGTQLSGGERQRIAIARTFLRQPAIMLYDEHSSAMDTITEQSVEAVLADFNKNRTCIYVAHKLSSVIDADEILVMHNGEIVERGPHWLLLTNSTSLYSTMFVDQLAAGRQCNADDDDSLIATGQLNLLTDASMWDKPHLGVIERQMDFNDPDARLESMDVMSNFPG